MGVLDGERFATGEARLDAGDTLFVYTDGVTEAMDSSDRQFGETLLKQVLSECAGMPSAAVVDTVMARLGAFVGGAPQSDDITIQCLRSCAGETPMAIDASRAA